MSKLPALTPRKIIRVLERKDFILDRVKGVIGFITTRKQSEEWLFRFINEIYPKEHCLRF